ncbi:glycosyltransferase family 4 protein [Halorubrum ezzemoulense]|nr:glycosyltransferase family 4 protein [Halorubrum ezzemoulense]
MEQVQVVHKYGAPRHYSALESKYNVNYLEYLPSSGGRKYIRDLISISDAFISGEKNIIAGFEPYSPLVYLFDKLRKNNNFIYHTSWPFWDDNRLPVKIKSKTIEKKWEDFLSESTIVTVTNSARSSLASLGIEAVTIPHSVDTTTFFPKNDSNNGDLDVLFVGVLEERKGVKEILNIVDTVEGIDFTFVGDGPLSGLVSKSSSQHDNVTYHGYISDQNCLASIYRNCDIMVLPSKRKEHWEELFGIVIIEAMASGLPVIASDCVGPKEVVKDGRTGQLISQGSQQELRTAIQEYRDDKAQRINHGRTAREYALRKYSEDVVISQWLDVIE